jgi:aminoglycoside phosphotransferase (APT) family kinase protein
MRNSWNRATSVLDFGTEQLTTLIAPAFPGCRVVECAQTEGGLANTNIRLRLSDGRCLLLRLFVRDPRQAAKEWKLNALVHKSVPSPEFMHFSADNPISGHPYILMEWIDGVRLESVLSNLDENEARALARCVGEALAAVHDFKFANFGFFDEELQVREPIDLGGAGLISYAKQCLVDGIGGKRLGERLTERVLEFLEEESGLLDEWDGKPCLSHSDFGGSNILVYKGITGWKVAAVLDWEFAFSGTPFFDFGNLLRDPTGSTAGFETSFEDGYRSAGGKLPQEWRRMSRLADLTAWMEFMTRNDPGDALICDAQRIITHTMDCWD